jgi:hypothetical protein
MQGVGDVNISDLWYQNGLLGLGGFGYEQWRTGRIDMKGQAQKKEPHRLSEVTRDGSTHIVLIELVNFTEAG